MGKAGKHLQNVSQEIKELQAYNHELHNQIKTLEWKLIQKKNIIDHMVDTIQSTNDLIQKVDASCDTEDLIEKFHATCDTTCESLSKSLMQHVIQMRSCKRLM
jgi:peptidoglycan hydrolase CwlO-like protein